MLNCLITYCTFPCRPPRGSYCVCTLRNATGRDWCKWRRPSHKRVPIRLRKPDSGSSDIRSDFQRSIRQQDICSFCRPVTNRTLLRIRDWLRRVCRCRSLAPIHSWTSKCVRRSRTRAGGWVDMVQGTRTEACRSRPLDTARPPGNRLYRTDAILHYANANSS